MVVAYDEDDTRGAISDSEQRSIASCIKTIASTAYGTVPYARDMGLKQMFPKNNSEIAQNEYAAELAEAVEEWEDRVGIKEVIFERDHEVKVVVEYGEQRA